VSTVRAAGAAEPVAPAGTTAGVRRRAGAAGRRVLPDLAAGALAGLLVGGVGGRAAMLVLRLTSPDGVRGLESDDGFTIGRFGTATAFLLLLCAVLGALAGLFLVVIRPLLPRRGGPAAYGVFGGVVGGAAILHDDGIDFALLRPRELAVVLFVAIPGLGAWAIAVLADRWRAAWPGWSTRRRVAALVPAAPWAALVTVSIPTLAATVAVDGLRQVRVLRRAPVRRAALVVGRIGLLLAAGLGARALVRDVPGIL
jgi:hypothetical protein